MTSLIIHRHLNHQLNLPQRCGFWVTIIDNGIPVIDASGSTAAVILHNAERNSINSKYISEKQRSVFTYTFLGGARKLVALSLTFMIN